MSKKNFKKERERNYGPTDRVIIFTLHRLKTKWTPQTP